MAKIVRTALLALALLFGADLPGQAQAPRPAPAAPAAPALDPAQAASKSAFDRLDEAERKAIQNDLIWTGDFNGVAGGEFGRRTYDAMLAFERRSQSPADGILAPAERAALKAAADAGRAALRFGAVTDPATGIRIGVPGAMLTQRVAVENGAVYRRPDGAVTLQLVSLPAGQTLPELFERMRQDGPGRKVTYRLQRPDWFVVSGEEGARKFYTRLAQGPDGVRGYTFRYPADQSANLDRIMIAIANTFEPFPGTEIAANPARAGGQASPPPLVQPALRAVEPRHAISGVALGPGRALTSAAALKSCASPTVGGQPVAASPAGEVAILAAPGLNQPALAPSAGAAGGAAFTLSFEDAERRSVMVAPGRLDAAASRVSSALQIGAGGAPVLDSQGRLLGLVRESARAQRMVAGVSPEATYAMIPLAAFRSALPDGVVTPSSPGAAPSARLVAAAAASLVEIRCAARL
jgi:peptidoglycan hydrolase-like protein with peptidoglycan-binding domain